ncbi:MAG: hypothetical protein NC453_29020 [Muribaculum sp.]|nr:hypothetical protein [Muribaculum sp.]
MEDVFFIPYIGKSYGVPNNIFGGKKILAVGHNHHCDKILQKGHCRTKFLSCNGSDTIEVVERYLSSLEGSGKWEPFMNTYQKFANFLIDQNGDKKLSKEAWESIAFYNFAQYAVPDSMKLGQNTEEEYRLSHNAFFQVLRNLQPDIVLCWSVGNVYNRLPKVKNWHFSEELSEGNKRPVGFYDVEGCMIKVIAMNHPSSRVFIPKQWHDKIFPIMGLE